MSKHTPGPWKWVQLEFSGYYHELHDADGIVVCDDGSAKGEYGPEIDVKGGNARLIAAAPELLEALSEVVAEADSYTERTGKPVYNWLDKARAAIAKAIGEE